MENAEIIVPQIDKLRVGRIIPKKIKRNKLTFSIEGTEMKKANKRIINSVRINMKKQNKTLLNIMILNDTGDEINPARVPVSCSFMNNLVIINIIRKIVMNHI